MTYVHVLSYGGELSVKARGTRNRFSERLARNLADALTGAGLEHQIQRTWSRIYVESPSAGGAEVSAGGAEVSARVAEVASRVFGVKAIQVAERRPWEGLDDLLRTGEEIFAPAVAGKTFAVRVRRGGRNQKLPFRSPEVERRLGALLVPGAAGVDLTQPQVEARVELRRGDAYFSHRRIAGPGGLPLGTGGRALALISGGFDSAVAAWLMLRRGVMLDYLFLNLGGDGHRDAVLRVVKTLADDWSHGTSPRLHMVDFRPRVEDIQSSCPQALWQVVLKRQMLRAADAVARLTRSAAVVTGEAIGQVSSQTLQNLVVISAVTEIPVLRPLVTSRKEEILELARRIGTHDLCAGVPEHCALTPGRPETHAKPRRTAEVEARLDPGRLAALVEARAVFDLRALDLGKLSAPDLEVDAVPEGAVVLDLRSAPAYKSWHYPGALRLDYAAALTAHRSFDPEPTYLIYCEVGLKSAHLAELMHRAGYRAHHFRGGLKHLMRHAAGDDEALRVATSPALLHGS